jgi:hypothetical protein
VQLEAGTTASPFEYRQYGTELALCQRYYYKWIPTGSQRMCVSLLDNSTVSDGIISFPAPMRIAPTTLTQSGTAGDYTIFTATTIITCSAVPALIDSTTTTGTVRFTVSSGLTTGQAALLGSVNSNGYIGWSAEL